ncbi:hypothetical protein [Pseudoruegeria sp. SK021]|uniref:hypothetical protein n=1 Tax=Pseudoruegeria sp. SK021 TaxID=1933035 RepID=UPI000A246DAC|nr:hypothetical protein [Pseudoruegeria sp. SK021]OSP56302.1 hypothetical protein BV911_03165 [Pseudoruegeria sp. SK021]
MNESRLAQRAVLQGMFVVLCTLFVFIRLLPLNTGPDPWPGPDLMLALTMAWAIRRPDLVPVWLVAPVFFVADMLLMHPPGLWTALVILTVEWLRKRQRRLRTLSFLAEFALVALLVTLLVCLHWLVLTMAFVSQPGLGVQLVQVPITLAAYPVVVLLGHYGFGVTKRPAPEGFGRGAST